MSEIREPVIQINQPEWRKILKGDLCAYCGAPPARAYELDGYEGLFYDAPGPMQVDHIKPRHHGGGNGWQNLTAACGSCNASKGVDKPLHFMLRRRAA